MLSETEVDIFLTVKLQEEVFPLARVAFMVAVPALTAVIFPLESTVATDLLLLVHVITAEAFDGAICVFTVYVSPTPKVKEVLPSVTLSGKI